MKKSYVIMLCDMILIIFLIFISSCSMRKFYPLGGSIVGGAAGSIGGPVSAGLGAGAGWTVGELAKGDAELTEAKETIKAITTGDVQSLVEKGLAQQKGTYDKIIDGIYKALWLCGIGAVLWLIVPVVWAKSHVKRAVEKHVGEINGKD